MTQQSDFEMRTNQSKYKPGTGLHLQFQTFSFVYMSYSQCSPFKFSATCRTADCCFSDWVAGDAADEPDVVSLSVSCFHVQPLCSCFGVFGPTPLELGGTSSLLRCAEMQTEVQ